MSEFLENHKRDEEFKIKLKNLINEYNQENKSDTPDYILAIYVNDCLDAFNRAVITRDVHYDNKKDPATNNVNQHCTLE